MITQFEYKGYKYQPYEDYEPEEVTKIFHDVVGPDGEQLHMDVSPYHRVTEEEFKTWVDLRCLTRKFQGATTGRFSCSTDGFTIVSMMIGIVLVSILALTLASVTTLEAKTRKTASIGHEVDSFMYNAESVLYRPDKCSQVLNGLDYTASSINVTNPFTGGAISGYSGNSWRVSNVALKNVTTHECYKRADLEITFNLTNAVGSAVKTRNITGVFFLTTGNAITACYGRTPPLTCPVAGPSPTPTPSPGPSPTPTATPTPNPDDGSDQFDDNGKDKVYVCHSNKTLKVSKEARDAHLLEHTGDYDGKCEN